MSFKSITIFCILLSSFSIAQTHIQDAETKEPVSFATISFGNGNGIFADETGKFIFTKKLYHDVDSVEISAIGYKNLKIATLNLPPLVKLQPTAAMLQEVIVQAKPKGKFKIQKVKPVAHQDYFKCWLPTIESEIAVFFPNTTHKPTKISKLYLPIKTEAKNWDKRRSKNAKKRPFSTLF